MWIAAWIERTFGLDIHAHKPQIAVFHSHTFSREEVSAVAMEKSLSEPLHCDMQYRLHGWIKGWVERCMSGCMEYGSCIWCGIVGMGLSEWDCGNGIAMGLREWDCGIAGFLVYKMTGQLVQDMDAGREGIDRAGAAQQFDLEQSEPEHPSKSSGLSTNYHKFG